MLGRRPDGGRDDVDLVIEGSVTAVTPGRATTRQASASRQVQLARAEAFAALTDHHLDASYRLAAVILGDRAEAEDATHDAAVLAWRRFGSLRDHDRFEAWFGRILVNVCRDRLRSRGRQRLVDLGPGLDEAIGRERTGSDGSAARADRDALGRAVDRLGPDHRIVLALRYWRDLPVDAIADRLGLPSGTVKSRIHHALRHLRAELERDGWHDR